jgi:phosphotransferase system enzyme I (PtsI)
MNDNRKILEGKGISRGYAFGKAFIYRDILSRRMRESSIRRHEVQKEIGRIKNAFGNVIEDIREMEENVEKEIGRDEAGIFRVHMQILKDRSLIREIEDEIKNELVKAEDAARSVFRRWANRLKTSDREQVRSKADDIEDLTRRVLCSFLRCDISILENIPSGSVVVAKRLLPSDTVRMKSGSVKAVVVEEGGDISHGAIISRALGIPAVSEIDGAVNIIKKGEDLIVDGYKGLVLREPDKEHVEEYEELERADEKRQAELIEKAREEVFTAGGETVSVYANVSSPEEVKAAADRGFDGIGLLRIEQVYMASKVLPDEEDLLKVLGNMLKPAESGMITFRLLDIGADKQLPYIDIEDEPEPILGLRGIRLLLRYRNILRTQLNVAIKLSRDYDIRVLLPVVSFADEVEDVKRTAEHCLREIKTPGVRVPPIGAMIETPAAVENVDEIAVVSDFLSVGTNDLIQYAMAAGRDNAHVQEYYDKGAGLAVKYVERVVRSADTRGIDCTVCGEMAGEFRWTDELLEAGLRNFSVSPFVIPGLKEHIRTLLA